MNRRRSSNPWPWLKSGLFLLATLTLGSSMGLAGQEMETLPLLIATEQRLGNADSRCVALGGLDGDGVNKVWLNRTRRNK